MHRNHEGLKEAVRETRAGRYVKALDLFEQNISACRATADEATRRLLSYYGLCLSMVWGEIDRPLTWCREALETERPTADLFYNLGMVHLRAKRRDLAFRALHRGLDLEPDHRGCRDTLDRLRLRRKPVFSFLERKHPLNKYCGMVRNRILGL